MQKQDKTPITIPGRSAGDGMENIPTSEVDAKNNWSSVHNKTNFYVPQAHGKKKEPKFVPYEPYKAAVSPMLSSSNFFDYGSPPQSIIDSQKVNSLASSIIKLYSDLENKGVPSTFQTCTPDCSIKVKLLEDKISSLEKEKKELMSQYQVQTEVNADLKKMLVASLGEDVQLKVQFMTEDKAYLGKQVLNLSEELDTIKEERDKLFVQCDVWESKFKASSLMVKELIDWKSCLSQQVHTSIESLDALMKEHITLFEMLCTAHSKLQCTLSAFDPTSQKPSKQKVPSKDIFQLVTEVTNLSNNIQKRLLGTLVHEGKHNTEFQYVRSLTQTEQIVNKFLKSFEQKGLSLPDGKKCGILPHICTTNISANFCKHCCGEVKIV